MKLHKMFTMFVVFAMLLGLVPVAAAQGPVGDWVSGIACQNLDDVNDADVTLSFYLEGSGTSSLDYDAVIPAGGSANYYTPSSPPGVPENFLGSVVIQSSTPLACNVNTQTTGTGTAESPRRVGTSAGFGDAETSTTMYAPQVMKALGGAWSSYIAVQNATASDVTVTVTYKDASGNAVAADETDTIPGYSNRVFYQGENANLPAGFIGAATVTGTGAIAVTVNFYNAGADAGTSQLHSYNGFSTGSTSLLIPRFVRRFYGYNSGLSIQNIGTAATTVEIAFSFSGVTYNYTSPTIQPGAALPLYATNITELLPVDSLPIGARFGSAVITTASEPVIAIVNEDNRGVAADNNGEPVPVERIGQGTTYNSFLSGAQTTDIFFAQIVKAASVFSGGFQVTNTTSTAGNCTATFNAVSPALTFDFALIANGSASVYAPSVAGLPATYNGSVSVACDVDVVGISNMAAAPGTGSLGDSFTQGNGLNR